MYCNFIDNFSQLFISKNYMQNKYPQEIYLKSLFFSDFAVSCLMCNQYASRMYLKKLALILTFS